MTTLSQFLYGLKQTESSGNYNTVGKDLGALGAYQIMPSNIQPWGAAAGYPNLTKEQFLASPSIQDAVAGNQAQLYYNKYGNWGSVAQAWLGGPGNVGKNVSDPYTGISTNTYANTVLTKASMAPDSLEGSGYTVSSDPPDAPAPASAGFSGTPLSNLGFASGASKLAGIPGVTASGNASMPGSSLDGGTQSANSGPGSPIVITDATSIAANAGESVKQGDKQLGTDIKTTGAEVDKTVTSATQSLTSTATGGLQYFGNLVYDTIARVGVGLLALVFILVGLWFLNSQKGNA